MSRNFFKSKKVLAAVSITAAITIAAGSSFAWFVAKANANTSVSMAHLSIGAEFEPLGDPIEPGITAELAGVVKNTGSTGVLIKMALNPASTIKWDTYTDEDGLELLDKLRDEPYVIQNDTNIILSAPQFNSDPSQGPIILDSDIDEETGDFYIWKKDKNTDEYYLLIEGNTFDVPAIYGIEFSGPAMGNKYQDADIAIGSKLLATQWWSDGALQQYFGINFDDLEDYPDRSGSGFGRSLGVSKRDLINKRIAEIRAEK